MLKNFIRNIRISLFALMHGVKNTQDEMFSQKTSSLTESNTIQQQMQMNELGQALLKGEVNEQVEMLRDRTYLISDESKKYKVIIDTVGTSKAVKKKNGLFKPPIVFNDNENSEIKLVVDNNPIPTSVLSGLSSVGTYGIPNEYPVKFEYKYTPKFKLEEYVKKIVVRSNPDDENIILLDFYVPKFTDSFERMEKIFDNEILKVKDNKIKPINLEFEKIEFISNKSYGIEDGIKNEIHFVKFIGINYFDGKHIITYQAKINTDTEKITEKYKNEKLREAYANNEKRTDTFKMTGNETCICDKCGEKMENAYDYRITKYEYGYGMCKKCLEKYNDEKNK